MVLRVFGFLGYSAHDWAYHVSYKTPLKYVIARSVKMLTLRNYTRKNSSKLANIIIVLFLPFLLFLLEESASVSTFPVELIFSSQTLKLNLNIFS